MNDFDALNNRFQAALHEIGATKSERALTMVLIGISSRALPLVPRATSTLINSQYRDVQPTFEGYRGEFGFVADYAAHVHEAPGTLMGTNTPRWPRSDGFVWDPNAEPKFLEKGAQEFAQNDFVSTLREAYR